MNSSVSASSGHAQSTRPLDTFSPKPSSPPVPTTSTSQRNGFGTVERGRNYTSFKQRYTPARPDPWPQLKWAIFLLFALAIWASYVFVGRVCTPMARGTSSTGLGRSTGVGGIVGFVMLWLMFAWTYVKMITTGPGYARDRVPKAAPPKPIDVPSLESFPYNSHQPPPIPPSTSREIDASNPNPSEFAPLANIVAGAIQSSPLNEQLSSPATDAPGHREDSGRHSKTLGWRDIQRPVPRVELGPRWCRFCEINKPDRTHHCRHCGTCVLQFDHHCLWLGHCVGWGNHKFFITFNFWAMLFCFYTFAFLVVASTKDMSIDGQVIALIAVSALCGLFTAMMLPAHVHLILTGKTTVESFHGRDQHDREAAALQQAYGYLWHNREKQKVKRKWKEDWGGSAVDSRWKWGSAREMWIQEMGESWTGWILPIGRPLGDGVSFQSNSRFGPNGEWLQRKDWPVGVQ